MELLNVKLIKTNSMFCVESAAASVARWLNRNYEMMFCRMWGFGFQAEEEAYPGVIGKRIISGFNEADIFEPFEIYHGIKINFQEIEQKSSLLNSIMEELKKGMPVAVLFFEDFPRLISETSKDNHSSFLLIIGREDDKFVCLDIHNGLSDYKVLPINNISETKSSLNKNFSVYTFSIVRDEQEVITYNDFLLNFKKTKMDVNNSFKSIRDMAECIDKNLDFERERCNSDSVYYIPLLYNIMNISRARKLISNTLEFIWKKSNNPLSLNLSMDFLNIGDDWTKAWNMMTKLNYLQENDNLKSRIVNTIIDIANKEELLINKIINNDYNKNHSFFIDRERYLENGINNSVLFLDIKKYFNNKAFASDEYNRENANFSGQGEFFLRNGLPENNILNITGMKFLLNNTNNNLYDNISCSGQDISLPQDIYKRIMFLGCCEWGERYGDLNIVYSDGEIGKILLFLPDWCDVNTDVVKAWKGQLIGPDKHVNERYFFAVSYLLESKKEIVQIKLPDITNMHIFAISLEKCD